MYDTVVVPTDGSEHARRAAAHGAAIAGLFGAAVHVITVVDVADAAGPFDAGGVDQAFVDRLEADAEATLAETADAIEADVETAVVRGAPADAILTYLEDHGADLVAMGTHGRTGVRRYIAGSVTERVLRLAEVPVLTARAVAGSRRTEYDEVLIPTDGSDPAAAAVEHGVGIARRTGARVHTVNVVNVGALAARPDLAPPTEVIEAHQQEGESATAAIASRAREAGLEARTEVREGYPARALLAYADEHDVDLITMGTHGRSGLSRYLLGSTTERVIRQADMPVVGVKVRDGDAD